MKRKLSAILAAAMLASSFGMSAMAEESVQARFTDYDQVNQAITVIAGTDTQKELGYLDGVTTILEVDGHKFKDLNGNGQLDVYEDWRQDVDARVKDLYDQMTREERAGLFYHVNTSATRWALTLRIRATCSGRKASCRMKARRSRRARCGTTSTC